MKLKTTIVQSNNLFLSKDTYCFRLVKYKPVGPFVEFWTSFKLEFYG